MKKSHFIESSHEFGKAVITSRIEMVYNSSELFDKLVLSHYGTINTGDRDDSVSAEIFMTDEQGKELMKFLMGIYGHELKKEESREKVEKKPRYLKR